METTIEKTINGNRYQAIRKITGKVKIRQSIIFMGHEEHDSETYSNTPKGKAKMDAWAVLIFWQLLARGWLGQSPLEPEQERE